MDGVLKAYTPLQNFERKKWIYFLLTLGIFTNQKIFTANVKRFHFIIYKL